MPEPTVTVTFTAPDNATTGKIEVRRSPTGYSPDEYPDNSATGSPAPAQTWALLATATLVEGEASIVLPANSVLQARFILDANPHLPGSPAFPVSWMRWTDFRVPNTGPRKLLDLIAAYNVHPTPSHLADIVPTSTLFNPAA